VEEIELRKKQVAIISIFSIIITYLALFFQWTEFFKGYSYNGFNLYVSIMFLVAWFTFSFFWGIAEGKIFKKFIIIYWGINIVAAIIFCLGTNIKFIQETLFLFYIWFVGPLYGLRYIFFRYMDFMVNIGMQNFMLLTAPLGMLFSSLGYWIGCKVSKLIKP
jgi:hypothetical protein